MGKLSYEEVSQGHTAGKWSQKDLNSDLSDPRSYILFIEICKGHANEFGLHRKGHGELMEGVLWETQLTFVLQRYVGETVFGEGQGRGWESAKTAMRGATRGPDLKRTHEGYKESADPKAQYIGFNK